VASASVTREEEAPVSRAALAELSRDPCLAFTMTCLAFTMTVGKKDTLGGD